MIKTFNYNYDYLKDKIDKYLKDNNLKLSDISNKIGISEQTLKKTLNNKRDFKLIETYKLIQILKIDNKDISKAFFIQDSRR